MLWTEELLVKAFRDGVITDTPDFLLTHWLAENVTRVPMPEGYTRTGRMESEYLGAGIKGEMRCTLCPSYTRVLIEYVGPGVEPPLMVCQICDSLARQNA